MRALLLALLASLIIAAPVAAAPTWHAEDVIVYAPCEQGQYVVYADIVNPDPAGAFVQSIDPATFAGSTGWGFYPVTVVIAWPNSSETQTFSKSVEISGNCPVPSAVFRPTHGFMPRGVELRKTPAHFGWGLRVPAPARHFGW
jgi:hypothetical protein